jgi:hypothetical protein
MKVSTAPEARYQMADLKSCLQDLVTLIINKTVITEPMITRTAIFGVQFFSDMTIHARLPRSKERAHCKSPNENAGVID